MKKKANLKDNRTIRRYSEPFKIKVLRDLEEGRMTKNEIIRHYNIAMGTLFLWIKKYNRVDLYNPRIYVQMPHERDQIKALKEEVAELKEAMVAAQLRAVKAESDLEAAMEKYGISKEDLKKKSEASRSKKQSRKGNL